ncbi:MAG: PEGA domain-containing protein [Verrucomicrobia bacterium]|nr:PEGA domain-containing protein [Verrucomicrobiota bacterium]
MLADDLRLGVPVVLRKAGLASRLAVPWWRRRARTFTCLRHPNYLNVLDLVRDGGEELVVTERPSGPSLAELLRAGVRFTLEDVVRLLPLTILDVTAALTASRKGPTASEMFVEGRDRRCGLVELATQPVSDWPTFLIKVDLWNLIQPGADCRDRLSFWPRRHSPAVALAIRYTARLIYELLGGAQRSQRHGRLVRSGFKPIPGLKPEANALLKRVMSGRMRFNSSEEFLWELEKANGLTWELEVVRMAGSPSGIASAAGRAARADEGVPLLPAVLPSDAVALPATARAQLRPAAVGGPTWSSSGVTALVAGAFAAAMVLGAVVYEQLHGSHPAPFDTTSPGTVSLQAEPDGVQVTVDGAGVMAAPAWKGQLTKGTHRILVSKPGFASQELNVEVESGKLKDLGTVTLEPLYGGLSLAADMPHTAYEVIGPNSERFTGLAPVTLSQLGPGRYTVRLHSIGWSEYLQTVDVTAGQTASVNHTFAGQQDDQAFAMMPVPFPVAKPLPSVGPEAEGNDTGDESAPPTADRTRTRAHSRTRLSKNEAFRQFEAAWDAKERAVQSQIAMTDRRLGAASGASREQLKAQRSYLERRRDYVRQMRRYRRSQLRHRYGVPDPFMDRIRNALGF